MNTFVIGHHQGWFWVCAQPMSDGLLCNDVSHYLGANLESALHHRRTGNGVAGIGPSNGLSPVWHRAITLINADSSTIGHLGTNFSWIWIEIWKFSFKKMHLKMSEKSHSFCTGLMSKCCTATVCLTSHMFQIHVNIDLRNACWYMPGYSIGVSTAIEQDTPAHMVVNP